ncbi:MAG: 50S ribosomal protein L24 [Verrucomicrobia bacterium]|nr:50S ribosomal protein L24 [Verrucomicrobiota bacterium]
MIQKFHVKKGDQVQVISGNHKGAVGKILQVLPKKSQVLIEGVRLIKKHTRKSQEQPQGAIIEREGPIQVSNVKIVEPKEAKPAKATKEVKPKAKAKPAAKAKKEKAA